MDMVASDSPAFWQQAYADHSRVILAFLGRRLRNRSDAEDLLQETFVRAMRSARMDDRAEQRTYLLTIARNLLSNRARRGRLESRVHGEVQRREPDSDLPAGPDAGLEQVADPQPSPELRAEWATFRADLERALGELGPDLRLAFELAVLERWSYAEVAERTGWSLPRVKTNVFRARHRMIATLGDRLPHPVSPAPAWEKPS